MNVHAKKRECNEHRESEGFEMNVHAKKRECNEHRESGGFEMAFAQLYRKW